MSQKNHSMQEVDFLRLAGLSEVAIAETAVWYSQCIGMKKNSTFTVSYKAESAGAVKLKIELEQSTKLPATEGASDGEFVVPDGAAEINNDLEDEIVHHKAYQPASVAYGRFKITGLETNAATTKITKLMLSYVLSI